MRSAYQVLGVPGNADAEDIEIAFQKARLHYSPERLAASESAVEKFNEIQTAYKVLKDPAARAAHDRKLAAQRTPAPKTRVTVVESSSSGYAGLLKIGIAVVVLMFGAGFYVSHKNAQARQQQAALELALKQQQEKEAEQARRDAERQRAEREAAAAKAEADERRLVLEGKQATERAAADSRRQEAAAQQQQRVAAYEARRQEAEAQAERNRNQMEARRRLAADKQRIRELCWQNYRKLDC